MVVNWAINNNGFKKWKPSSIQYSDQNLVYWCRKYIGINCLLFVGSPWVKDQFLLLGNFHLTNRVSSPFSSDLKQTNKQTNQINKLDIKKQTRTWWYLALPKNCTPLHWYCSHYIQHIYLWKLWKDTFECMNPRFPLSGAREFPEYISSDRKLSREFQIQRNQTNIPPISKPKIHSLLKRLGVLMLKDTYC